MKGIILASLASGVSFVLATAILRLWRIERRAYAFLWVFAICFGLVIAVDLATPSDLMILPETLVATPRWFDLTSALFFFAAAFFGGVLQIYNLADRGLSLRILIDLQEQPDRRGTIESLFNEYGAGKGIGWMYQKRIDDMIRNGLIAIEDNIVTLTPRGAITARIFSIFRHLLRVEAS